MHGIEKEVAKRFEMDFKAAVPYRDGMMITSDGGQRFFLRKNGCTPMRVLFIHTAKEYIYNNGYRELDRYRCSPEGVPFVQVDSEIYTMAYLPDGSSCNFDLRSEVVRASKALGQMHRAAKGFFPVNGTKARDELGKLPEGLQRRLDEIRKMKKMAKKGKTRFDSLFLANCDQAYETGAQALENIRPDTYGVLVECARKEGGLCHHDYTHHNLICEKDHLWIVNFEYCSLELKVYDLANLIRRKMRKCNWNLQEAKVILDAYRSVESLTEIDFIVMKAMLQFPQKFWRVSNRYYNSNRSWSEKSYTQKLMEVLEEREVHQRFLEGLDSVY